MQELHDEFIQKIQKEFTPLFNEDIKPIKDGPIDLKSYQNSPLKIFFILHDVKYVLRCSGFDSIENDLNSTIISKYQTFDEFTLKNIEHNFEIYKGLKSIADLLEEYYPSFSMNHLGLAFMNKIPQHEEHYTNKIHNTYCEKYKDLINHQLDIYQPRFVVCASDNIPYLCTDKDKLTLKVFEKAVHISCYYDSNQNRYYLGLNRVSVRSFRLFREEIVKIIVKLDLIPHKNF